MPKRKRPPEVNLEDVTLPTSVGTYALLLHLSRSTTIDFPRFGRVSFASGWLVYVGSAFGAGGIRARVGRHLRQAKTQHWHIDWLLPHMRIYGYWYSAAPTRLECEWCHALVKLDDATIPLPGFGSSDCHAHCPSHLIALCESPLPRLTHVFEHASYEIRTPVWFYKVITSPTQDPTMPVHLT